MIEYFCIYSHTSGTSPSTLIRGTESFNSQSGIYRPARWSSIPGCFFVTEGQTSEIDPALAEGLAAAAAALPGPLVLFSDTGHDARLASREIIKALARHALAPAFHFEFQPQAPDPAAPLAALTQAPPRVVVIAAGPADAALLAMAVRKRFPAAQLFGTHSLACDAFIQAAGPASEGVRFPLLAVLDPAAPGARVFIERFRAEAGAQPDIRAALAYDAARLLLAAVRKAGLDRAGIREALQSLSPWPIKA